MTDIREEELRQAREFLKLRDPVMAELIATGPELDPDSWRDGLRVRGLFEALVYQIVGQQISIAALDAIYGRLAGLFPSGRPDPAGLAAVPFETLRGIGLSGRKAEYVLDVARRAVAGELDGIGELPHEEALARLVALKGIGAWTANGALLIAFGGGDVLVSGDLVMRKAVQKRYELDAMPSERDVDALGENWRPHRTLAAAYLFHSEMVPEAFLLSPD